MRLPKLLDIFAEFGVYDRGTWEVFARNLQQAGDVSTNGKRGKGASHVTARDVATILLAGMATSSPARATERVRQIRALPLRQRRLVREDGSVEMDLPEAGLSPALRGMQEICSRPTMGDALDAFFTSAKAIEAEQAATQTSIVLKLTGPESVVSFQSTMWLDDDVTETCASQWYAAGNLHLWVWQTDATLHGGALFRLADAMDQEGSPA